PAVGFGVVALGVALAADVDRRGQMHDQEAVSANSGGSFLAYLFFRGEERGKDDQAGVVEQLGDLSAAAEVFAPLIGGEAEVLADAAAHVLAVEDNRGPAFIEQASLQGISQRRF